MIRTLEGAFRDYDGEIPLTELQKRLRSSLNFDPLEVVSKSFLESRHWTPESQYLTTHYFPIKEGIVFKQGSHTMCD